MCKNNSSDLNLPLNDLISDDQEHEVLENDPIGAHSISRNMLTGYIKALGHSTSDESFITPRMALKALDLVHLLKHRTGINDNIGNNLIHKWYKEPVTTSKVIIPFNIRTKTTNELMSLLEIEFELIAFRNPDHKIVMTKKCQVHQVNDYYLNHVI